MEELGWGMKGGRLFTSKREMRKGEYLGNGVEVLIRWWNWEASGRRRNEMLSWEVNVKGEEMLRNAKWFVMTLGPLAKHSLQFSVGTAIV